MWGIEGRDDMPKFGATSIQLQPDWSDEKAAVFKEFIDRLSKLPTEDRAAVIKATAVFFDVNLRASSTPGA